MKPRILPTARISFPLATAIAVLLAAHSANAQTNGNWTQTLAGPFNWSDITNWSSGSGPVADGIGATANFTSNLTAGQTVNLSAAQTIGNINFDDQPGSNDLTISGANALTLDVSTGSPTIFVNGGGRILTISATVSGNEGLTKTGGGTLRLSGANDYSGVTNISNGSLNAANLGALGSTTGITIGGVNPATLTSALTGLTIPVSAPITTANTGVASTFSFGATAASTFTINSAIGGSGDVSFATPGTSNNTTQTVNLGAAGTYAGNTTISSTATTNTNRVVNTSGAANVLPTTTVLSFANIAGLGSGRTTTFDLNGQDQTLAGLSFTATLGARRFLSVNNTGAAATLTINNSEDYSFGGANSSNSLPAPGSPVSGNARIMGAIALTKTGVGTFSLGGTLSSGATVNPHPYTGATNILGGTLRLFSGGALTGTPSITINGSTAKLRQESSAAVTAPVTLTQGTLTGSSTVDTVNVGNATGGIVSNNNGVPGAALTVGALTFAGAAMVNTFSDSTAAPIVTTSLTTNVAGSVTINPSGATFGTAGTYDLISYGGSTISGGGFAQFALGSVTGASSRQNPVLGDSGTAITLTVGTDDPPYWVGDGDGKWNLASANNWKLSSNNTTTLFLAKDNVLFNDTATGIGPIIVDIDSVNVSPSSTTFDGTKDFVLNSSGSFGIDSGILTKNSTGSLTLNTANTYTGATAINAGTLSLGSGGTTGSLSPSSAISVASGATFAVNQSDTVVQGTDFGAITGDGGFTKSGIGTTQLSSLNTFTGNISVTGGTLEIVPGGRLNGGAYAGDIAISTGATFNYSGSAAQTLSGIVSGQGSIAKGGTSTLTLSGDNTYQGSTTVNGGTLNLGTVAALGSTSAISMADGAILRPAIDGVTINAPITLGGVGTTSQINAPFTTSASGTVETLTLNNPITGNGNLRLFSSTVSFNTNATIVLNAQSTYSGNTELNTDGEALHLSGVNLFVKLGVANALPPATVLTLDGNVGKGSGRTVSLDLNGFNQELAGLAAVTTHVARNQRVNNTSTTLATLTINSSSESAFGGAGPSSTFSGNPVNPTAKIVGNLALTKTGPAKFTLKGSHEFTGNTTVSQGILSQEAPNTFNDASTVNIAASGATLDLNFDESGGAVTDTVDKLFIGGVQQNAGVYMATDNVTDSGTPLAQITGPGTLTVTTGPAASGYTTWATTDAGGQGSELDFDQDGVKNGVEFFMNAPAGFTANPQLNASNTITWTNGGNIPASAYGTQFVIQTSSNLSIWTDILIGDLTTNTDGPGGSLTYTLTGGAPRFVRLKVTPN